MREIDPQFFIATIIVIFFGIGLHEYAHAKMADLAGDPTPRSMGRVTLNLFKHFDPIGSIFILVTMLAGVGIGWGKPVMVNPSKMRNPRWDHFASVAAGPLTNLLQACVYAIIVRVLIFSNSPLLANPFVNLLLVLGVLINVSLCFFNLIPLGPLDGHWLVGAFLPDATRYRWYMFNRQYGWTLLLAVIIIGQVSGHSLIRSIINPPMRATFRFLTGFESPI